MKMGRNLLPADKKQSDDVPAPRYMIGEKIRSDRYMGCITSAFYAEGQWNYNIGENASLASSNAANGYTRGPKYIAESNVVACYG